MTIIKELLNDEDLKKIAEILKQDIEILKKLTLDKVRDELAFQKDLLLREGKDAELNEVTGLISKLEPLDQQTWEDSCISTSNAPAPTSYSVVSAPDNKPFLLEATGNAEQQKATLDEMTASYKKITGKEPTITTYNNADELPEKLKDGFANKPFPLTVVSFKFEDIKQLQQFHKETLAPMINEGKLKLINDMSPQKSPEPEMQAGTETPRPSR